MHALANGGEGGDVLVARAPVVAVVASLAALGDDRINVPKGCRVQDLEF